jgi:hypothetical protein
MVVFATDLSSFGLGAVLSAADRSLPIHDR